MATFASHRDVLVECPYDKSHKIALRNQIKHIIECEKKCKSKLSVCIYNASHRMARHEFASHLNTCPDGRQEMRKSSHVTNEPNSNPTNGLSESQMQSKASNMCSVEDQEGCEEYDEWCDDNAPEFCIYDQFVTDDKEPLSLNNSTNTTNKLTKNQKKRNRRKAGLSSAQNKK